MSLDSNALLRFFPAFGKQAANSAEKTESIEARRQKSVLPPGDAMNPLGCDIAFKPSSLPRREAGRLGSTKQRFQIKDGSQNWARTNPF
jgi:hypothetical protein